jgi:hypothetical protein
MFGSTILEVAVGLALMFLMLSLVASAVREGIEGIIKARAVNLERGIRALLDDKDGMGLARTFYEHPLINSLFEDRYAPAAKRFFGRKLPTYIPGRQFAAVLIDLARRGPAAGPYATLQTAPASTSPVADVRANVQRIPSLFVQRAFLSAIDEAEGDMNRVRENLEAWFDGAMNSVSGAYRRRTQLYLFAIGLVVAAFLNVNTFTVADHLWRDDRARAALAERAGRVAADTATKRLAGDTTGSAAEARRVYADLRTLSLPIGWDRRPPAPPETEGMSAHFSYWSKQVFGLALTAFAIMLGAPFWFDMLNKFIVIRSTVKPREKTGDEGSEDRKAEPSKDRGTVAAPATPGASTTAGARTRAGVGARATARAAATPVEPPPPPHVDQEWASGTEEGIL